MNSKEYLVERIKNNFPEAMSAIKSIMSKEGNLYRYLAKAVPIKVDGEASVDVLRALAENQSPACTNGDYVAISSDIFANNLAEFILEDYSSPNDQLNACEEGMVLQELKTVLFHEYTHILYAHTEYKKNNYKKYNEDNFWSLVFAQEVQANRGYQIDKSSLYYKHGFTEQTVRERGSKIIGECLTQESIYNEIKNVFKDELDKEAKKEQNQENKNEEQSQQKNNKKSMEKNENGQSNQASNKSNQSKSQQSGNKPSESQGESKSESESGLSKSLKKTVQQLAKQYKAESKYPPVDLEKKLGLSPKSFDPSDDKKDEPEGVNHTTGGMGGMESENLDGVTPRAILTKYNNEIKAQCIKKNLGKLKGIMKGDLSRGKEKTYSRPPRRTVEGDLMRKGIKKTKATSPSVLVALDKSGSMDCARVTAIAEAIDKIVKQIGRNTKNCYICLHDGHIKELRKLKDWQYVVGKYNADGGNNFAEVFQKAKELKCDVVLNVGDGLDEVSTSRDKALKNTQNKEKPIHWYDVLVTELGTWSDEYWLCNRIDHKRGIERTPLDVCEGLSPLESFGNSVDERVKSYL